MKIHTSCSSVLVRQQAFHASRNNIYIVPVIFLEQGITQDIWGKLTPDLIKELIPKIGIRALFLEKWRLELQANAASEVRLRSDKHGNGSHKIAYLLAILSHS